MVKDLLFWCWGGWKDKASEFAQTLTGLSYLFKLTNKKTTIKENLKNKTKNSVVQQFTESCVNI